MLPCRPQPAPVARSAERTADPVGDLPFLRVPFPARRRAPTRSMFAISSPRARYLTHRAMPDARVRRALARGRGRVVDLRPRRVGARVSKWRTSRPGHQCPMQNELREASGAGAVEMANIALLSQGIDRHQARVVPCGLGLGPRARGRGTGALAVGASLLPCPRYGEHLIPAATTSRIGGVATGRSAPGSRFGEHVIPSQPVGIGAGPAVTGRGGDGPWR